MVLFDRKLLVFTVPHIRGPLCTLTYRRQLYCIEKSRSLGAKHLSKKHERLFAALTTPFTGTYPWLPSLPSVLHLWSPWGSAQTSSHPPLLEPDSLTLVCKMGSHSVLADLMIVFSLYRFFYFPGFLLYHDFLAIFGFSWFAWEAARSCLSQIIGNGQVGSAMSSCLCSQSKVSTLESYPIAWVTWCGYPGVAAQLLLTSCRYPVEGYPLIWTPLYVHSLLWM